MCLLHLSISFRNILAFNFSTSISALLKLPQSFFPFFRLSPLMSIVYIFSIGKWLNWFENHSMIFSGQAMNVYWLTTNIISMSQSRILKIKPIREKFGIGELKKWNETDLPMNQMSLFGYVSVLILNTKNLNLIFGIDKILNQLYSFIP